MMLKAASARVATARPRQAAGVRLPARGAVVVRAAVQFKDVADQASWRARTFLAKIRVQSLDHWAPGSHLDLLVPISAAHAA